MTLPPWVRLARVPGEPYGLGELAPVTTPEEAVRLFDRLREEEVEVFACAHFDARQRPLALVEVSRGTVSTSLVHPREVFRAALVTGASGIVLAHNHPSGDPTPSPEDVSLTQRLVHAGKLLGVDVLDHVILAGATAWTSLRRRGLV